MSQFCAMGTSLVRQALKLVKNVCRCGTLLWSAKPRRFSELYIYLPDFSLTPLETSQTLEMSAALLEIWKVESRLIYGDVAGLGGTFENVIHRYRCADNIEQLYLTCSPTIGSKQPL